MSKYTYAIEVFFADKWHVLGGMRDVSYQFALGYMTGRQDLRLAPRPAQRVKRSDGKVIEELTERDEVNIGMIVGFASAEQYRAAAARAIAHAEKIEAMTKRKCGEEDDTPPHTEGT